MYLKKKFRVPWSNRDSVLTAWLSPLLVTKITVLGWLSQTSKAPTGQLYATLKSLLKNK